VNERLTAEGHAYALLHALGIDVDSPDMQLTPRRMVMALADLALGARAPFDVAGCLSRTFEPPSERPQLVILAGIPFESLCEHHLLPFSGIASVGYLPAPGARVAGISKLARLVRGLAAQPQMQERLGEQVIAALGKHLDVQGAGCLIEAEHLCMTARGPRARGARMVTSHLAGCFFEAPLRQEFMALAR
jgi:GTP cyclohydrolase IA